MKVRIEEPERPKAGFVVGRFYTQPAEKKLYLAAKGWDGMGNHELVLVKLPESSICLSTTRNREEFRELPEDAAVVLGGDFTPEELLKAGGKPL